MFFTGFFAGYRFLFKKLWIFGIVGVISLPFITSFEMTRDHFSHNLWPLEFIFTYPYFAAIIIAGASVSKTMYEKNKNNKLYYKKGIW